MAFNEKNQSIFIFLPMFFWPHSGAYNGALSEEMVEGSLTLHYLRSPGNEGTF